MLKQFHRRSFGDRFSVKNFLFITLIVILASFAFLTSKTSVVAHAELVRSSPPQDGLLAAPPQKIDLWMSERVDAGGGSPAVKVLDDAGTAQSVTNLRVDPDDPRHIEADVSGISGGTYTVVWTVRSLDDGHLLTGSFAFRVGSGSVPGAATVEGQTPQAWAVATRWLTFLGLATTIAALLYRTAILAGATDSVSASKRRALAGLLGGIVATTATALEPFLQTQFPPIDAITPTFQETLNGMPTAWWLRLGAAAVTTLVMIVAIILRRNGRTLPPPPVEWLGAGIGLVALMGLSFTGHGAGRETWRTAAIISDTIHQWSVALWVGGLAILAISWSPGLIQTGRPNRPTISPIQRFSLFALFLAVIGVVTGVINAGLLLPTLADLWSSNYGYVIIAKTAVLLLVLALAAFHRRQIHRAAQQIGMALRTTVRLEAAIVIFVVLGGSILALTAPPIKANTGTRQLLDLGSAVTGGNPNQKLQARLQVKPAKAGENEISLIVQDTKAQPIPADEIALLRLDFESLSHQTEQRNIELKSNSDGIFSTKGSQLSLDGWWRVSATIRQLGFPDATSVFYIFLPDPNVNGFESAKIPSSNSDAEAIFNQGLESLLATTQVRYFQELGGGTGTFIESDHLVDVGGAEPAVELIADDFRQITIGTESWFKLTGEDWTEEKASPIIPPAEWGSDYANATAFQLGVTETINGVETQMISFYVPQLSQRAPAWFAWWVDPATGHILRETMISRSHYMVNTFTSYGEPLGIKPPTLTPTATPVASPAASPIAQTIEAVSAGT